MSSDLPKKPEDVPAPRETKQFRRFDVEAALRRKETDPDAEAPEVYSTAPPASDDTSAKFDLIQQRLDSILLQEESNRMEQAAFRKDVMEQLRSQSHLLRSHDDKIRSHSQRMAAFELDSARLEASVQTANESVERSSQHDADHEARVAQEIIEQRANAFRLENRLTAIEESIVSGQNETKQEIADLRQAQERLQGSQSEQQNVLAKVLEGQREQGEKLASISDGIGQLVTGASALVTRTNRFFDKPMVKATTTTLRWVIVFVGATIGSCYGGHAARHEQAPHNQEPPHVAPIEH